MPLGRNSRYCCLCLPGWRCWQFAFRDLRRARNDAVRAAYERFCRKLARRGLPRHPAEGPLVYGRRAAQCRPEAALEIASITERYVALRYGDSATPQAVREFQRSVRRFAS